MNLSTNISYSFEKEKEKTRNYLPLVEPISIILIYTHPYAIFAVSSKVKT